MLWDSPSEMSRKGEAGTALAAGISAWKLPTSFIPSRPSPSVSQIFVIKGLHAPQRYHLIVSGEVCILQNTGCKRIKVYLRNPGPKQVGQPPATSSESTRTLAVSSSPASGQEVRATGWVGPFPFHATHRSHSMIFRKGFPGHNRTDFFSIPGICRISEDRGETSQSFIQMPIHGGW